MAKTRVKNFADRQPCFSHAIGRFALICSGLHELKRTLKHSFNLKFQCYEKSNFQCPVLHQREETAS